MNPIPIFCKPKNRTGFTGCGKTQNSVILSEAKNLSLFLLLYLNRREILRFAQNDRTRPFFRSLFSLSPFARGRPNPRQAEDRPTHLRRLAMPARQRMSAQPRREPLE